MDETLRQALSKALFFLRYRPRTRMEVYRRLKREHFPEEIIYSALENLEKEGHFDDFTFSRVWAEERTRTRGLSLSAIRRELSHKGVSRETVERALTDFEIDEEEVVFNLLKKKGKITTDPKKLISLLQRRGYSYQKAKDYVKRWLAKENTE